MTDSDICVSLMNIIDMKQPAKIDVAELMLFFNRPDNFQKVFDEVKKARPAQLFLYQDGARGERDVPGIEACRQIASDENIDWECEVHRSYQTQNQGCDPSEYLSQKWAFSIVDKCIVLEDDDVPSQSFFPFCKEMLDRSEHDERIAMIAGFNEDEVTPDCEDSYFFTSVFSIWGWASWRRVVDKWECDYAFLRNKRRCDSWNRWFASVDSVRTSSRCVGIMPIVERSFMKASSGLRCC